MRLLDMSASMCAGSGNSSASAREGGTSERPTSVPKPNGAGKQSNLNKKVSYSTMSALLEPFSGKNGGSIPISSRAGADIAEQKTANRIGLLESWRYIPFLTHQATSLASAFVSHHVFGPPKKSWGIEMTLFTTAVRESVQYSHLSSLDGLRKFLNLGQILPTPRDGVVTPVTFRVKRRGLPGLLKEADESESGTRELTGEWVVSKRIWRKMQQEHYGNHHDRHHQTFPTAQSASSRNHGQPPHTGKDKVILYLHGGAYYVMSAATHRYITISVSKYTDCRVFAVNYRLAPECRWPGQIHDAVLSYLRLTQDLKIPSENIIFAGDSAGGGLCLATMMYLRDNGLSMPCGAILMSPWVDLSMSCDSWETNAPYDYLRMPSGDDHMNPIASYLGAANVKRLLTHPYVSPLFGEYQDLPPLLIQCGDAECLRDEATLLAHKASLAGVQVFHEVYEDCPHVFQALFFLEASKKAFRSHRQFVKRILPQASRSKLLNLSSMDKEVMSDAHAIKADGEPDPTSLPTNPSHPIQDDEDDGEASAEANASDRGDEYGLHSPSNTEEANNGFIGNEHASSQHVELEEGDPVANAALRGIGAMVHAASKISPDQHHDLDRVDEEQDDSIMSVDDTDVPLQSIQWNPTYSSKSLSVPTSPSSPFRNRHRSLSLLSITPTPTPLSTSPSQPLSAAFNTTSRPSHSRQNSSQSNFSTTKSGLFRQNSRPKARQNSHPDLQALLDSYEKSPSHHTTILWRTDNSDTDTENSEIELETRQYNLNDENKDVSYGF